MKRNEERRDISRSFFFFILSSLSRARCLVATTQSCYSRVRRHVRRCWVDSCGGGLGGAVLHGVLVFWWWPWQNLIFAKSPRFLLEGLRVCASCKGASMLAKTPNWPT